LADSNLCPLLAIAAIQSVLVRRCERESTARSRLIMSAAPLDRGARLGVDVSLQFKS
jgi:hypothetical protein